MLMTMPLHEEDWERPFLAEEDILNIHIDTS